MKKKLMKGLLIYGIVFFGFILFRLLYGYLAAESSYTGGGSSGYRQYQMQQNASADVSESGLSSLKNNYASAKRMIQKDAQTVSVDQKYEKVGSIYSQSREFEKSEGEIRSAVSNYGAVIQYENNSGLKGSRYLYLVTGVVPEKFDSFIETIRKIGVLKSIEINKFDKTSEYKDMNAKLKSLEESRNSLMALKTRGGSIQDFIQLQTQILEIEKQIQFLGVKLGDYNAENELCTVKITLSENMFIKKVSLLQRIKDALEWSVKIYGILTIISFFGLLSIWILLLIIEKMKWVKAFINQTNNK